MAAIKPYNPIVKIEGMFNGCVMRLAQSIKEPVDYGENTRLVIQECAKQFQDALDDCEIQILDAKWYLEHQLAVNKARREAKTREENAAVAKRKHDQVHEPGVDEGRDDDDSKRPRLLDPPQTEPVKQSPAIQNKGKPSPLPTKPQSAEPPPKPDQQPQQPEKQQLEPLIKNPLPEPINPPEKPPDQPIEETPSQTMADLFQSTPQVTPTLTNDEFGFVSMFGQAPDAGEGNGDGSNNNNNNDDMNFDLDLGDGFPSNLDGVDHNQNPADLDSLLPGLESYANQTENDTNDSNPTGNQGINFELPPLEGPNEFDAFLDANHFDSADLNLTDEAMDIANMDFDTMFNDGTNSAK